MRTVIQAAIGKALLVLEEPTTELSAATAVPSTTPVAACAPIRAAEDAQ
jgi:hypothetical protein